MNDKKVNKYHVAAMCYKCACGVFSVLFSYILSCGQYDCTVDWDVLQVCWCVGGSKRGNVSA